MSWQGHYINLDRSEERRRNVEREIGRHGLAGRYRRFPAIDGERIRRESALGAGELGIFQSHMALLDLAAQAREPFHVIEDDVLFCDLTQAAIDKTVASPALARVDLVFTETYVGMDPQSISFFRALVDRHTGRRWPLDGVERLGLVHLGPRYLWGATSYVVGAQGARRLLDLARAEWDRGPTMPFDDVIQRAVRAGSLQVGCIVPFVTAIDIATAAESTAGRLKEVPMRSRLGALLRNSFFARRDLRHDVLPRLDALLGELQAAQTRDEFEVDRRVLEAAYLIAATRPTDRKTGR